MDDSLVGSFLPPAIIDDIRESGRGEVVSEIAAAAYPDRHHSFHVTDVAELDVYEANNKSAKLNRIGKQKWSAKRATLTMRPVLQDLAISSSVSANHVYATPVYPPGCYSDDAVCP